MARRSTLIVTTLFVGVFVLVACKKPKPVGADQDEPEIPENMPNYAKSSNDELAYLGRVLFYDKKLSSDNTISCASCHEQSKAFADGQALSTGILGQKTTRNSPSIFPKNGKMFWDGRARDLGEMVIMPITNHIEMNIKSIDELCTKLSETSYYPKLFKRAFKNENISKDRLAAALREFVTNFDFSKNKFKASQAAVPTKMKDDEIKGQELFFGKAKCAECHHLDSKIPGPGIGNGYGVTDVAHNVGLDEIPNDMGVGEITKKQSDNGKFMMPVLLNCELTAPYMHDGRFATLEQVVEHYNTEIKADPNLDWRLKDFSDCNTLKDALHRFDRNRDGNIDAQEAPGRLPQKLNLDENEKAQLVKFLKTLTDKTILTDDKFDDPFVH